MANASRVVRDPAGRVSSAVLVADRADYLTDDGVIDPAVYLPGDLTRSLCAPWQYDFRECGCFYWAASKPDISASSDGTFHPLNFQRSGDRTKVPPELDGPNYFPRNAQELDHPALITKTGTCCPSYSTAVRTTASDCPPRSCWIRRRAPK
ncbi:LodA/GoxA family CTQ-dependent oxidase [Streptomyces sp. NPDC085540]|uniref:LodA/GoxA family CTQ-dependent oxidase n=1 Tax=Streptomyces sp. NPDC085540 TaxID=3365730 RepID=UPI0037CD9405